jgi:hypothetical protein
MWVRMGLTRAPTSTDDGESVCGATARCGCRDGLQHNSPPLFAPLPISTTAVAAAKVSAHGDLATVVHLTVLRPACWAAGLFMVIVLGRWTGDGVLGALKTSLASLAAET